MSSQDITEFTREKKNEKSIRGTEDLSCVRLQGHAPTRTPGRESTPPAAPLASVCVAARHFSHSCKCRNSPCIAPRDPPLGFDVDKGHKGQVRLVREMPGVRP
jgi:hypothetical protein